MAGLYDGVVKRNLNFFWLVDCSGSMEGQKMATLNQAIQQSIPEVKKALSGYPEVNILMSSIKFSNTAEWHIGPEPVPIEDFFWPELNAGGVTSTAQAINLLIDRLDIEKMGRRAFPPVYILLSDGYCTDTDEKYDAAINKLNSIPWGRKAVRLVIAIGNEGDYDEDQLLKFTNHKEDAGILKASNPERLVGYIKWASTTASLGSIHSLSNPADDINKDFNVDGSNVILPPRPVIDSDGTF
jgi:uncharacterized protein YegL